MPRRRAARRGPWPHFRLFFAPVGPDAACWPARMRRGLLSLLLLAAAPVPAPAAAGAAPAPPRSPSILLITLDTTRADFVGGQPSATPHLDALAARGARFTRAI